jgi:hypothetical protein
VTKFNKLRLAIAAALVALTGSACSSATDVEAPAAETSIEVPSQTPDKTPASIASHTPEPLATPDGLDEDEIIGLAFEIAWSGVSPDDQETMCLGWALDEEQMIDAFLEGATSPDFHPSRAQTREFFDGKC